jgi:lysophospholipase L1-like esterase
VLRLLIPDFFILTNLIIPSPSAIKHDELLGKELQERFSKMKQLAESKSIRIAILIAPESKLSEENIEIAFRSASKVNIDILVPIKPVEIHSSDFSDGFHLNTNGANNFTKTLADTLRCYLPKDSNCLAK